MLILKLGMKAQKPTLYEIYEFFFFLQQERRKKRDDKNLTTFVFFFLDFGGFTKPDNDDARDAVPKDEANPPCIGETRLDEFCWFAEPLCEVGVLGGECVGVGSAPFGICGCLELVFFAISDNGLIEAGMFDE